MNNPANIDDIWKGDLLERQKEAMHLQRYLENIYASSKNKEPSSFVLNINSEWGHGKTWFLKRFANQLEQNHTVVYFDAWKNDFTKDALLSFVSVICSELERKFKDGSPVLDKIARVKTALSTLTLKALPILAGLAVKQLTGMSIESLVEHTLDKADKNTFSTGASEIAKLAANSAVDSFVKAQNAIEKFESAIKALIEEIEHLPIYIFVDELDRCRPTYAIELLESIKHLFSVKGIFFIVATDTKQLSHSIKAVYGNTFNATGYLKRFFYAEYCLAEPNYQNMAKFLFEGFDSSKLFLPEPLLTDYNFPGIFAKIVEFFKLTVRDQEQVFNILETVLATHEGNGICYIFLLLLICSRHKNEDYVVDANNEHDFLNRLFNKASESKRFKNVNIETYCSSLSGNGNREHLVREILSFHIRLLNKDLEAIQTPQNEYFIYQARTIEHLLRNTRLNRVTGKRSGSNELFSYFDLISQAGRITVN